MLRRMRMGIVGLALCAVLGGPDYSVRAATITVIDLNVGGAASIGIQFNGTVLSTAGPQNTPAEFMGFLDWYSDVPTPTASFTLDGVTRSGSAAVFGGSLILQPFTGGTFSLYDAAPTLLLSGSLSSSALSGTAGLPGGGLFTTSLSSVTGGIFAPFVKPSTMVLQMHLSNINGGDGLAVGPTAPPSGGELYPFTADVTANIDGEQIPEPATDALLVILSVLTLAATPPRKPRNNVPRRR